MSESVSQAPHEAPAQSRLPRYTPPPVPRFGRTDEQIARSITHGTASAGLEQSRSAARGIARALPSFNSFSPKAGGGQTRGPETEIQSTLPKQSQFAALLPPLPDLRIPQLNAPATRIPPKVGTPAFEAKNALPRPGAMRSAAAMVQQFAPAHSHHVHVGDVNASRPQRRGWSEAVPVVAPETAPLPAGVARATTAVAKSSVMKLPQITALFWALKMAGTTLGETGGDFISEGLHFGFLLTFFVVMAVFLFVASAQVRRGHLVPGLYWTVIVMTSMAGTEMADFIFHTLGIGVVSITLGFIAPMVAIYLLGKFTGGSFSVTDIRSRRDEMLYWALILTSNTIGTGIGDGLARTPLGVLGSTIFIACLMGGLYWVYANTKTSRVALFWAAFVLTRPLGATGGDLLWKPHAEGGLGLGRVAVSLVLIAIMAVLINRGYRKRSVVQQPVLVTG